MNPYRALDILHEKMTEYGLTQQGWIADTCRAKKTLGYCYHGRKLITLSFPLVMGNSEEIIHDTIRHEIAHALVGAGHGHNYVWKRKAIEVGAIPKRCSQFEVNPVEGKYQFLCGCPDRVHHFHRKTRRTYRCKRCQLQLYKVGAHSPVIVGKTVTIPLLQF